jgi:hypothetical protein
MSDLIAHRTDDAFDEMEPEFTKMVNRSDFGPQLEKLFQYCGWPLDSELKQVGSGVKVYADGHTNPTRKFTYAATTNRYSKGVCYFSIEVAPSGSSLKVTTFGPLKATSGNLFPQPSPVSRRADRGQKDCRHCGVLSVIGSAAYACSIGLGPMHPMCRQIAFIGLPGILAAAVVTIAGLGSHGGGPLGMLLAIATPVNCDLYLGLGVAAKRLANIFKPKKRVDQEELTDSHSKDRPRTR